MTLLLGTREGLYVAPDGDTRGADRALDVPVNRVRRFDGPGLLAATDDGVYRSVGGREWADMGDLAAPVHAIQATPEGRIYAGARPPRVYATDDGGETWREVADLGEVADPGDHSAGEPSTVRALAAEPRRSRRVLAGIDPGGVVVSEDGGNIWAHSSLGLDGGVNHLLRVPVDASVSGSSSSGASNWSSGGNYVAATSEGAFRTADAGDTWHHLDDGPPAAHLAAAVHEGTLFTVARDGQREVVSEYEIDREFDLVRRVDPPTEPGEVVRSFAGHMGRLLAGTVRGVDGARDPGRVLVRDPDGTWSTLGETPAGVLSMVGI